MNKQKKGFTLVELLVVIGILGILMGALFPAISAAMLNAQTAAMQMRGRNLFVAITQCNTEREGAGLPAVWPQQDTEGLDDDDKVVMNDPYHPSNSAQTWETDFLIGECKGLHAFSKA